MQQSSRRSHALTECSNLQEKIVQGMSFDGVSDANYYKNGLFVRIFIFVDKSSQMHKI